MTGASAGFRTIGAVRPASVCTTIFGTPVVPDVSSTHSVANVATANRSAAMISALQAMRMGSSNAALSDVSRSMITASASTPATSAAKCEASASGGRMVRRRATPSSSIRAKAVVSWLLVATTTDLPSSCSSRPPKLGPPVRSATRTPAARSQKNPAPSATRCRSDCALVRAIFVDFHEIAESHGKQRVLGSRERINAEPVFKAGDKHGKAERVEAGIQQNEIVTQRGQNLAVLARDLRHLVHYG